MLVFLVFTLSGVYWAFDPIRDMADGWMGTLRPPREAAAPKPKAAKPARFEAADLGASWATFQQAAPDWQMAFLRPPERASQPLQILWVAKDAPHVRARSSMSIDQQSGALLKDERYAAKPLGARFQSTIYPLHLGTYYGITGQIIVFIAALALPGFGITGWMLYLDRRRQKRSARAERAQLAAQAPAGGNRDDVVLVAYASQTGQAERLALQSAAALQAAGVSVDVQSLEHLTPRRLRDYRRALFVASSFGDGEAPDSARAFARQLAGRGDLSQLQYAVLALGDRNYSSFCGFGHTLERRLAALHARPLQAIIEVDNGDAAALARWADGLRGLMGTAGASADVALNAAAADSEYTDWRLAARTLLNPGSIGLPLYELTLAGGADAGWRPGALVDIWPGHYGADAAPRRYSLASLPQDGSMQLIVRQVRDEHGLGLASGWLTEHAAIGDEVRVRLVANPSFDACAPTAPAIYIGNGSGLAGLRAHLRARVREGARRNWLVFGERQQEYDAICADEIQRWRVQGFLPELDLVYSRDVTGGGYVQDRLRERADTVRAWVDEGAVLYVCGSLRGMAGGVDDALADILGKQQLARLAEQGRYRRDVY
jgi:sulfite reductase (NADPH) flavoprotein alpha-component